MSLGGDFETHATIPSRPALAQEDMAAAGKRKRGGLLLSGVRLGEDFELRVLKCVGHHCRRTPPDRLPLAPSGPAARGARGRIKKRDEPSAAQRVSASTASTLTSDYPLLLLHAQVAVRRGARARRRQAEAAAAGQLDDDDDNDDDGLVPGTSFGPSPTRMGEARRKEAQELGDAIERMLLG